MRSLTFQVLALGLFTALTRVGAEDIISALQRCNCNAYAEQLQTEENAPLLDELQSRNDGTIWCPPDNVVNAEFGTPVSTNTPQPPRKHRLRKRAGNAKLSRSASHSRPRPRGKRQASPPGSVPNSNFETLITYVEDPEFVNLGPDQPGRFVKSLGGAGLAQISSGRGNIVNQTGGPCRYDQGVIFTIDDFPSLPDPFTVTLNSLEEGSAFQSAVEEAGRSDFFDNTAACTIFVPLEFDKQIDPNTQIVCPLLGYTPDLLPGENYTTIAGTIISVTFGEDGARRVNGQSIIKPDIITKNGVIHIIAKPFEKPGPHGGHCSDGYGHDSYCDGNGDGNGGYGDGSDNNY